MRGKWAAGIAPRNFTWIIKDHLAVSERPGGSAPNHRRVRRQEEIIWLRVQGFSRVVSLLPSPHNLAAYDEGDLASSHFPLGPGIDTSETLVDLYSRLDRWLGSGERVLLHQEELGDRVMGVVGGYLLWCGRLPAGPQAIAVTERLVGRQMGPPGRDIVAAVVAFGPSRRSARTSTPLPGEDGAVVGGPGALGFSESSESLDASGPGSEQAHGPSTETDESPTDADGSPVVADAEGTAVHPEVTGGRGDLGA